MFMAPINQQLSQIQQIDGKNTGKLKEIQVLKREVDLYSLSSRLQKLNKEQTCKECIRKDQEIQTLIKALKALRSTVSNSSSTIRPPQQKQQEMDHKIVEQNKNQECFELSGIQFAFHEKSCNNIQQKQRQQTATFEDPLFERLKLKSQNRVYLDQIEALRKKVELCQKKIFILEQKNRALRKQFKAEKQANQEKTKISIEMSQGKSIKNSQIKVVHPVDERQVDDIRRRIPTFSSVRANVTKQVLVPAPQSRQTNNNILHSRLLQQTIVSRNTDRSRNEASHRYRSKDEDLLEQRKRSLDYKIKILEHQNQKLRREMYGANH